jgi:hypothetical protein
MREVTVVITTEFTIAISDGVSLDDVPEFALEVLREDIANGNVEGIEVDILEEVA